MNTSAEEEYDLGDLFFLYFFVDSIAVIGNLLIIICIIRYEFLHKNRHYLIASLAVCDLLAGAILLPADVYTLSTFYSGGDMDAAYCTQDAVWYPFFLLDIVHLSVIAVEQYVGVLYPLRYEAYNTLRITAAGIATAWLGTLSLYAAILLTTYSVYRINGITVYCAGIFTIVYRGLFYVCYGLVATLIVCVYARIWLEVRRVKRRIAAENFPQAMPARHSNRATRAIALLVFGSISSSAVNLLAWLLKVSAVPGGDTLQEITSMYCTVCTMALNPFVYGWKYAEYRRALKKLFIRES